MALNKAVGLPLPNTPDNQVAGDNLLKYLQKAVFELGILTAATTSVIDYYDSCLQIQFVFLEFLRNPIQ